MAKKKIKFNKPKPKKPDAGIDPKREKLEVKIYSRAQKPNWATVARSTVRLQLLRLRYPSAKYTPLVNCPYCRGEGEVRMGPHPKPCVCLYVEHSALPAVMRALQQAANTPEELLKTLELTGATDFPTIEPDKGPEKEVA